MATVVLNIASRRRLFAGRAGHSPHRAPRLRCGVTSSVVGPTTSGTITRALHVDTCDQKCGDRGIAWQNASTRQLATRHDETPAAGRMRFPFYYLASHVALLDAVMEPVARTTDLEYAECSPSQFAQWGSALQSSSVEWPVIPHRAQVPYQHGYSSHGSPTST
ncbi:uncharacterized protein LOC142775779 isoform X1 [Rhipicephalus microplus]|uniref:uncharacterized protein LOC142775779 isoform X1 n=1 Tax=Rhipicephalus microplus TaxID=6941 RepID=UPI003F6C16BF